jgi:hypothetical protein
LAPEGAGQILQEINYEVARNDRGDLQLMDSLEQFILFKERRKK